MLETSMITPSIWFKIAIFSLFQLTAIKTTVASLPSSVPISPLPTSKSCPTDLKTLTNLLLEDLPNYSNRVLKRTQDIHQDVGIDNYIIVAGQPELEPLNLPQINYDLDSSEQPEQIFFTTLERQYFNNRKIERETYHWLFVTLTDDGWYMFTLFSRFGDSIENTPPSPPQETSDGIIGQAISLWLRDCRAGVV